MTEFDRQMAEAKKNLELARKYNRQSSWIIVASAIIVLAAFVLLLLR